MERPAHLETKPTHQAPPTMISVLQINCLGFLLSLLLLGWLPDQISLRDALLLLTAVLFFPWTFSANQLSDTFRNQPFLAFETPHPYYMWHFVMGLSPSDQLHSDSERLLLCWEAKSLFIQAALPFRWQALGRDEPYHLTEEFLHKDQTPWHISVERSVGMMFRKDIFSIKRSITTLLAWFSPPLPHLQPHLSLGGLHCLCPREML